VGWANAALRVNTVRPYELFRPVFFLKNFVPKNCPNQSDDPGMAAFEEGCGGNQSLANLSCCQRSRLARA
jgi:hypothetical protein